MRKREREGDRKSISMIWRKKDRRLYYWKSDLKMSKNLNLNLEQVSDIKDDFFHFFIFYSSMLEFQFKKNLKLIKSFKS